MASKTNQFKWKSIWSRFRLPAVVGFFPLFGSFLIPTPMNSLEKKKKKNHVKNNTLPFAYLVVWKNDKSTAARWFNNNGQEFWVNRTKCWIPATLRYPNIIITLFTFQCRTVNMSKFWAPHYPKGHFDWISLSLCVLVVCFQQSFCFVLDLSVFLQSSVLFCLFFW